MKRTKQEKGFREPSPEIVSAMAEAIGHEKIEITPEAFANMLSVARAAIKAFQEAYRSIPGQIEQELVALAQRGWYIDLKMTDKNVSDVMENMAGRRFRAADALLCKIYSMRIAGIAADVSSRYPKRRRLLQAAVRAHRRGENDLAIPVLLAQADGIFHEAYRFSLSGKGRRSKVRTVADRLHPFHAATLGPLASPLPLLERFDPRSKKFNRHAVLHGIDLNYGTEINFFKALSFVSYASFLAEQVTVNAGHGIAMMLLAGPLLRHRSKAKQRRPHGR